jgi:hypothetical protein
VRLHCRTTPLSTHLEYCTMMKIRTAQSSVSQLQIELRCSQILVTGSKLDEAKPEKEYTRSLALKWTVAHSLLSSLTSQPSDLITKLFWSRSASHLVPSLLADTSLVNSIDMHPNCFSWIYQDKAVLSRKQGRISSCRNDIRTESLKQIIKEAFHIKLERQLLSESTRFILSRANGLLAEIYVYQLWGKCGWLQCTKEVHYTPCKGVD